MFLVRFHMDFVSVFAIPTSIQLTMCNIESEDSLPYIPVGLTMVSSPKMCLVVPAISSKAFVLPGVIGDGSSLLPTSHNAIWKFEAFGESSKDDTVKLRDLARGFRTETMWETVASTEDVLLFVSIAGPERTGDKQIYSIVDPCCKRINNYLRHIP